MLRRLAFIFLAYCIATGAATLALGLIGNLRLMAQGETLPFYGMAAWLLDAELWFSIALWALVPAGLFVWLIESRKLYGIAPSTLGGVASGQILIWGQLLRAGAALRAEPLLIVAASSAIGGLAYWALMRTVRR